MTLIIVAIIVVVLISWIISLAVCCIISGYVGIYRFYSDTIQTTDLTGKCTDDIL